MKFSKWAQIPALVSAPHQKVSSGKILRPKQILALESAALKGSRFQRQNRFGAQNPLYKLGFATRVDVEKGD